MPGRGCAAALGRKNFLFVGTNEAGENLAGLYSLIATCDANGVNPVDYLADVLLRVQTHPASRFAAGDGCTQIRRRVMGLPVSSRWAGEPPFAHQ